MFVASEEATSGSVIEKAERIVPCSSGSSHCCFCSGVPNSESSSMLPVSGAEQFSASGAIHGLRPVISASGAYCRLVSPAPCSWVAGRNRFHSPRRRASALSSSMTGGVSQRSPASTSARNRSSFGWTSSSMNASRRSRSSCVVVSNPKSMPSAVLPDGVALLQEGLDAFAGVLGLVGDVAGHRFQGDQGFGVAVEAAVGGEFGDPHGELAFVEHRGEEVRDGLFELLGRGGDVGQPPLLAFAAGEQLAGHQQFLGLAQAD